MIPLYFPPPVPSSSSTSSATGLSAFIPVLSIGIGIGLILMFLSIVSRVLSSMGSGSSSISEEEIKQDEFYREDELAHADTKVSWNCSYCGGSNSGSLCDYCGKAKT